MRKNSHKTLDLKRLLGLMIVDEKSILRRVRLLNKSAERRKIDLSPQAKSAIKSCQKQIQGKKHKKFKEFANILNKINKTETK